ncbi:hypothetical protein CDAR_31881 [Caerostris darwini]|uniref:Uncharacterized protein n=1 Tax=Caerostris darwini TaxID=1538125 RepID=A0AAV4W4U4_9ARAC|nr:hypothetical protein CDAR_31881 [Caerostris darwini]
MSKRIKSQIKSKINHLQYLQRNKASSSIVSIAFSIGPCILRLMLIATFTSSFLFQTFYSSILEKGEKCVLFPARFGLTVGRIIGKQLLTRCPVSSLGRVVILYDGNVCLAACSGLRGGMSC